MSKTFAALGLAASLCAIAAPLQAADGGRTDWPTLEEVTASSPAREVVKVDCDNAMWPTVRQVARYSGNVPEDSVEPLRRRIVTEGRAACASGFTHALIVFKADEVAIVVPALQSSKRDG
ncbi:hypothetical protein ACFPOA_12270 [Lysobacter niabensis]|uniref:hypothetical protein n=1 Tax=Agrilutibacter niabensis TaxID=380628 RepID=UPI00361BE970